MNDNWVMLILGIFLVVFGSTMTAVSGAMPGAKPLYPPPLRFRLILICGGVVMFILGVVNLIRK